MIADRALARHLAQESLALGDPFGWFEALYAQAAGDEIIVPWADMAPNPNLQEWLQRVQPVGAGKAALVIGCGLGDDAEAIRRCGFQVTAFDIAPSAIAWCRRRFPKSDVEYCVGDLFEPPPIWSERFDFVYEAYTLQVLPAPLRQRAMTQIANFVGPSGRLLVISRGRDPDEDPGAMPWPLLRSELEQFTKSGLIEIGFEDYVEREDPPVRRLRAEYQKRAFTNG